MTKETSIYLDTIRFIAAILVVIYHTAGSDITGSFLWEIGGYGPTAVMVFFVLSGYVIGFVVDTKEKSITDYVISRVSRLYSIVVPALLLTFICNILGNYTVSEYYQGPWIQSHDYLSYISSFFMVQDVWNINMIPDNNGSFWSLSYEFFYYIMFAALYFYRGKTRVFLFLLAITIAGPSIIIRAPIWGLGYLAYQLHSNKKWNFSPIFAIAIFLSSLIILAISPIYRELVKTDSHLFIGQDILSDYIDGIIFFLHLMSTPYIVKKLSRSLIFIEPSIGWLASLTFSIYLFHLPLIRLTAGSSPFVTQISSMQHISFVYGVTFLVIIVLGIPAEKSKKVIKKWLYKYTAKLI